MNNLHEKYLKVLNSWINKTLKDDSIELIILSGSVARGDETKHSDIDIAVYYKIKIPKSKRLFYKYKTVYIEQTNYSIKELNLNNILIEHKILFDKEGYTKNLKFDKTRNKLRFLKKYRIALKNLKLAKKYYNKQDYDKAILHILGTQSFTFITVHALPELFDLPYPTFRLLESIKQISKQTNTNIYQNYLKLWTIKNNDKIISNFEKIYKKMAKLNKYEGFFSKAKIHENILQIKITLNKFPKQYAYRFIIGCIIDWTLNKPNIKSKTNIDKLTKEILNINKFDKSFTKKQLDITKLIKLEIDKIIKNYIYSQT